jgi:hypothetical protein
MYIVAEATRAQREREEYAPPEPERTSEEAINVLTRGMRRREAELLAVQHLQGPELPTRERSELLDTPLSAFAEAGADRATTFPSIHMSPTIRSPSRSEPSRLRPPARESDYETGRDL